MSGYDAYCEYISLKNHFTRDNYDYFKYNGKIRTSVSSFNKRKDKYWYEKLSRQKTDEEVKNFFIANFVQVDDPGRLWIGELSRNGEAYYIEWIKRQQSLKYLFKEQAEQLLSQGNLNEVLDASRQHPPILKKYLKICKSSSQN